MLNIIFTTKYIDLESLIVHVYTNNFLISETLVDLGDAINVMTIETMENLGLPNLWQTPIVIKLADQSIVKLEGVLEDVAVSVDS